MVWRLQATFLGVALFATSLPPVWWLGLALMLVGLAGLVPAGTAERIGKFFERPVAFRGRTWCLGTGVEHLFAACLAMAITAWLFDPSWNWQRIDAQDHAIHFAKYCMWKSNLLDSGMPYGWSHQWYSGFPLGYLYPIGAYAWVFLWDILTLGGVPDGIVYSLALAAAHAFYGFSVFRVGRVAFGFWAGVIALVLALIDPGAGRAGGWHWTFYVGVWPNTLSMAFALMALSFVPGVVKRQLPSVSGAALFCGAALITHPMQLLFFPLAAVALALTGFFASDGRSVARALPELALAATLGTVFGGLWLVPFLSSTDWVVRSLGLYWETAYELGERTSNLEIIHGLGPGVTFAAIMGGWVSSRRRLLFPLMLTLLVLVTAGTLNASFLSEFYAPERFPQLGSVQFLRAQIWLRPLLCVLAAGFVHWAAQQRTGAQRLEWTLAQSALAVALLTALVPVADGIWGGTLARVRELPTLRTEADWGSPKDRQALLAYMDKHLPDPRSGFYRIAIFWGRKANAPMGFTPRIKAPVFKARGGVSAVTYKHVSPTTDPTHLRRLNVRYAIDDRPIQDGPFTEIARFGALRLYEFTDYNPEPFIVDGTGEVRLVAFRRREIVLHGGPGAAGHLELNVSNFSRWKAYIEDTEVEVKSGNLGGPSNAGFIRIPLRPGTLRIVFRPSLADMVSYGIAMLAFGLCVAFATLPAARYVVRPYLDAASRRLTDNRLLDRVPWGVLAVVTLGLAAAMWLAIRPVAIRGGEVVFDFEDLRNASVSVERGTERRACRKVRDRHECGTDAWDHVAVRPSRIEQRSQRHCVSARPPHKGTLNVRYIDVPLGNVLAGHYGILFPHRLQKGAQGVDFQVLVDGELALERKLLVSQRTKPFEIRTIPRRANVTVRVSGEHIPFCFHIQAVDR